MAQSSTVNQPLRVPLAANIRARDGFARRADGVVVDQQLVNCYAEFNPETKTFNVQKRPGYSAPFFEPTEGSGQGLFQFVPDAAGNPVTDTDSFVAISNGKAYLIWGIDDIGMSCSSIELGTVDTTGGKYKGLTMFYAAIFNSRCLVIGNGVKAYVTTGLAPGDLTDIGAFDPQFPTLFYKGFAYLNSRLYIAQPRNIIHGAENINDPGNWETLNVIQAQDESDNGVGIAKHNSFIVFFKEYSTEFFFDNGNPVGSPLLPSPQNSYDIGCYDVNSIQDIDGTLFWVTSSKNRIPQVARMDGTQYTIISTPEIEKILMKRAVSFSSIQMKLAGHRFYILSLETLITLVYDLDQQLWYVWEGDPSVDGDIYWPVSDCITTAKSAAGVIFSVLQDSRTGALYLCGPDYQYNTDNGWNFPVDIYTQSSDLGLNRIKNVNMTYFDTDIVSGSEIQVRTNDLDFTPTAWSNFRTVALDVASPQLPTGGSFYRRSYHIRHQKPCSFIIRSMSLQVDIGVA